MTFNPQDLLLDGIAEPDQTVRRRKIAKALRTKADPLFPIDVERNTPLHYALNFGHSDTLHQLLKTGISPNVINIHGETPLHQIADLDDTDASGDMAVALMDHKALLSHGEDNQRHTPLMLMILNKRLRVLARLIQKGKLWIGELVEMEMLGADQISTIQGILQDFERQELESVFEVKILPCKGKEGVLEHSEEIPVVVGLPAPRLTPSFSLSRMFPKLAPRRL